MLLGGGDCTGPKMTMARAHAYGDMVSDAECGLYGDASEILQYKHDYDYFCKTTPNQQEFAYRFREYSPTDKERLYPRLTDRVITASSGPCRVYTPDGAPHPNGAKDGSFVYPFTNGTYHSNITIPEWDFDPAGTTYIYRGENIPQDAGTYACGPRCIIMWAYKGGGNNDNATFYECPVTVGEVSNAKRDSDKVPNTLARLAAASIGLSGRLNGKHWVQYQFYAFG